MSEDEEEDEGLDLEEDGGDEGKEIVEESPSKRLPARKARASTFKEEPIEESELDDEVVEFAGKEMELPLDLEAHSKEA